MSNFRLTLFTIFVCTVLIVKLKISTMKKQFVIALGVVILSITASSFKSSSRPNNDVLENVNALETLVERVGMTCTMGYKGTDYFMIAVMCGIQQSDPCTIVSFAEPWGDRSTCGGGTGGEV